MQQFVHYGSHYVVPLLFGFIFFPKSGFKVSLVLLATNFIDIDHLIAIPRYDPCRCSIGFHPFHTPWAALAYLLFLISPSFYMRMWGLGCLFHLWTDGVDCVWMSGTCSL